MRGYVEIPACFALHETCKALMTLSNSELAELTILEQQSLMKSRSSCSDSQTSPSRHGDLFARTSSSISGLRLSIWAPFKSCPMVSKFLSFAERANVLRR